MSRLGHRITRRQTLGLAGLAGAACVTGCRATADDRAAVAEVQAPSCVLVPELTEGPFLRRCQAEASRHSRQLLRQRDRAGIPVALTSRIVEVGSGGRCAPYEGGAVDIWHCDAEASTRGWAPGAHPAAPELTFTTSLWRQAGS